MGISTDQTFKEIFEDAHGQPIASPFSSLLVGHVNQTSVSYCLEYWRSKTQQNDPFLVSVGQWLKDDVDPEQIENDNRVPDEYLQALRSLGCLRARIPVRYGGLGLSQVRFSRLLEMIASYSEVLALIVSVQQLGVAQGLLSLQKLESDQGDIKPNSEVLCRRYLRRLSENAIGAFCLTTPETGSDPSGLQTLAILSDQHDYYELSGEWEKGGKLYTTLGTIADVYFLLALVLFPGERLSKVNPRKRITAFIVDRETPGISIKSLRFCGWHGLPNAAIKLDGVRVPISNQVGAVGDGLKIAFMNLGSGRVNIGAISLGMMKQLARVARWWGCERVQGGQPIGVYQLNTVQLVKMNATIYAAEAFLSFVSGYSDQPGSDCRLEAAMLKLFSSHALTDIADETLQLRGGRGYETYASQKLRGETPVPVERLFRSARMMKIGEGGSNILKLYIMRCLLDELLQQARMISGGKLCYWEKVYRTVKIGFRFLKSSLISASVERHRDDPKRIRRHLKAIDKLSKRFKRLLLKVFFVEYLRYSIDLVFKRAPEPPVTPEQSLESKQVLLACCAEIAMYVSVMTVTCQRAIQDKQENAILLADEYCSHASQQISILFGQIKYQTGKRQRSLTERGLQIMAGNFVDQLEQDIVPFGLPGIKNSRMYSKNQSQDTSPESVR